MRFVRYLCLASSATAFISPSQRKSCQHYATNILHATTSNEEEGKQTTPLPSRRQAIATGVAGFAGATAATTYSPELAIAAEKVEVESVVLMGKLDILIRCECSGTLLRFAARRHNLLALGRADTYKQDVDYCNIVYEHQRAHVLT
jgi:hypothetical protein